MSDGWEERGETVTERRLRERAERAERALATARAEGYAAAREQAARDVEASRDTSPRTKEGDSQSGAVLRDYTWRLLTRAAESIRAMRDGEGTTASQECQCCGAADGQRCRGEP